MERFVLAMTGGGLALVAGLWLTTLTPDGSTAEVLGIGLVLLGIGGLSYGLWDALAG